MAILILKRTKAKVTEANGDRVTQPSFCTMQDLGALDQSELLLSPLGIALLKEENEPTDKSTKRRNVHRRRNPSGSPRGDSPEDELRSSRP